MGIVNLPNDLTNGTLADADEVQGNDVALRDGVNNIETDQIVDDAILEGDLNPSIKVGLRYTENGGQNYVFDGSNWITTTTSPDLNYTTNAFTAYVAGIRVPKTSFNRLYTANRDTYLDMDSAGLITFSEVTNGASQPAQTPGTLRLKKVITDGSTVTDVVLLAEVVAFTTNLLYEYKSAEININKNTGGPDVLGNQQIKVFFRGKDSTGAFNLDLGTSGVVLDTANKELPNGIDTNMTPTAENAYSIWVIGAKDGSQPDAAILSQNTAPFGIGAPNFPTNYDIARWHSLVIFDSNSRLIPGVTSESETTFHGHAKNIFPNSMNNTWTIIDLDALLDEVKEHVGHAYIQGVSSNFGDCGYADHSVTGGGAPTAQAGALSIAFCALAGDHDSSWVWVPLSEDGTGNFWSNQQVDGTSTGQQGGDTTAFGLSLLGFKYKHK